MIEGCNPTEKDQVLQYLHQRFGLTADLFADWEFYSGSKGRIILGPKNIEKHLSPDTAGLLIARIAKAVKPSSNLLQLFGDRVAQNLVVLDRDQTQRYVRGEDLVISSENAGSFTDGYVLLKYANYSLGCGLLKEGRLKNMLPRAKRLTLKFW